MWARWRVGGGWRVSSSWQNALIKVLADTRSLLLGSLSCHRAQAGGFGARPVSLGQSRTPGDTDGSTRPAWLRQTPVP